MWIVIVLLLLVFLLLFLIFPSGRRHSALDILSGLKIAHRGLHDINKGIPENSLAAARSAVKAGYAIENDIHITSDGEVVVFHDDTLDRACGVSGKIEDKTLSELKELYLFGTEEKIPTLKEFLEEVKGEEVILIELKCSNKTYKSLCVAADKILSDYKGKYIIQSFYPLALCWYKNNRSDILRGQLSGSFPGKPFYAKLLSSLVYNFLSRPDFVSYEIEHSGNIFRRLVTLLGALPVGWCFKSIDSYKKYSEHYKTYIFENFIL